MYQIYQVAPGDSLQTISQKIGSDIEELKKLNGIQNDVVLTPGSFLIIPRVDMTYKKYSIQKGDTMYEIAKVNGVDLSTLLKINGLDEHDYIYPGDEILIPRNRIYVTNENDTLATISTKTKTSIADIAIQNEELLVEPNQIIKYS